MKSTINFQGMLARIDEALAVNTRRIDIEDYVFDEYQSTEYDPLAPIKRCWNCGMELSDDESNWLDQCHLCVESDPFGMSDEDIREESVEVYEYKYLVDHGRDMTVWEDIYMNDIWMSARIMEVVVDGVIYTLANCGSAHTNKMVGFKNDEEYSNDDLNEVPAMSVDDICELLTQGVECLEQRGMLGT